MKTTEHRKAGIKLISEHMHGELIVKVCFEFNKRIIDTIKSIPGRRWNQENRHWYFPERQFNLPSFREALNPLANIDASALKPSPEPIPKETRSPTPPAQNDSFLPPMYMEKLIERRYSPNTIKTYVSYMKSFAEEFQDRPLASVTTRQINEYLLKLIRSDNSDTLELWLFSSIPNRAEALYDK